jgi:aspartate-semialdehyde dehydrogenase
MDEDVPLLIPEVNHQHLGSARTTTRSATIGRIHRHQPKLLDDHAGARACSACTRRSVSLNVVATTLQALSGAGYPGVASLDILDNVMPYIGGEEEKIETETHEDPGRFVNDAIEPRRWPSALSVIA